MQDQNTVESLKRKDDTISPSTPFREQNVSQNKTSNYPTQMRN